MLVKVTPLTQPHLANLLVVLLKLKIPQLNYSYTEALHYIKANRRSGHTIYL